MPFHLQECFAPLGHAAATFRTPKRPPRATLALPIYGELTARSSRRRRRRTGRRARRLMRVLVTGAAGLLGGRDRPASSARAARGHGARSRASSTSPTTRAVRAAVAETRPDVIINCAAYNDVDRAEDDPTLRCAVNAFGVQALARAARGAGAILVHYSSDFVFDGETDRPYT